MTWFKVDDKLHSHKKAARAGTHAMGLWVLAGSWCADQLTDGFVPDYIAARLDRDAEVLAKHLVDAGMWVEDAHDGDQGWRFKDWPDYQPTREDVESRREQERDKKRNQRRNKAGRFEESPTPSPEVSLGDNQGDTPRESDRPVPSRPVPLETPPSPPAAAEGNSDDRHGEADTQFNEHFWPAYPARDGTKRGKGNALIEWRKLTIEQRRRALTGARNLAASDHMPKDAERFLRRAKGGKGDFPFDDYQTPIQPRASSRDKPITLVDGQEFPL